MADEPKSFTFRFADFVDVEESQEGVPVSRSVYEDLKRGGAIQEKVVGRLGINQGMYAGLIGFALKPDLLIGLLSPPAKPLNRRQKVKRFLRNVKQTRLQRLHDWTTRKGAYCDSDY